MSDATLLLPIAIGRAEMGVARSSSLPAASLSSPQHDLCDEDAVLVGERAGTAVFFHDVPDGLDTNTASSSFGRLEYSVFFSDLSVKGVFDLEQKQALCVKIGRCLDSPTGGRGTQAGFQRVFQQIGKYQIHVDLIDREFFRQINLCAERNAVPLCQRAIIADHTVRCPVFAKTHLQLRNSGNSPGQVGFQFFPIAVFSKRRKLIQLMPKIVPRLPRFFNGGFEIFIPLLLQGQKLILLLQPGVPVQTGRQHQEDRIEPEQQEQQRNAENHVSLQNPPGIQRTLVARDHKQIERDEYKRKDPEHVPCPRKIIVLYHRTYCMRRRIIGSGGGQPANGVVADACPQAKPWAGFLHLGMHENSRIYASGQTVYAGEYRADGKCNGAGFPQGNSERFQIKDDRDQCDPRKRGRCG